MLKKQKSLNVQNNFELKNETKQNIKNKIINNLTKNGKKRTGEKIFLVSLKLLQNQTLKNYKKIVKLAIKNTTPIFLLKKVKKGKKKNRKEVQIPFLGKENIRIGVSIKNIIFEVKKKKNTQKFNYNLAKELYLNSKKKSNVLIKKVELQEQTLLLKKQLVRFRWF